VRAAQFSRFGGPEVLQIVDLPEPHAGPGEIRIRVQAAGVNASDWKKRQGLMDPDLPQTLGYEAAGIVDEVGAGVDGTSLGDAVFGAGGDGAAQAEFAVLQLWAALPSALAPETAAALPAAAETAARALDQLGVGSGSTLLVNGASGSVGRAAVQFAVARGARVLGTASAARLDEVRAMGAEAVEYGPGVSDRVLALGAPGLALDVAGNGILPELAHLVGGVGNVLTVADAAGAREHGVRFSRGDSGRATYALALAAQLAEEGRFSIPVGATYPLVQIARAHRDGEAGLVKGKIVLLVG